jgi:hypothetical protein
MVAKRSGIPTDNSGISANDSGISADNNDIAREISKVMPGAPSSGAGQGNGAERDVYSGDWESIRENLVMNMLTYGHRIDEIDRTVYDIWPTTSLKETDEIIRRVSQKYKKHIEYQRNLHRSAAVANAVIATAAQMPDIASEFSKLLEIYNTRPEFFRELLALANVSHVLGTAKASVPQKSDTAEELPDAKINKARTKNPKLAARNEMIWWLRKRGYNIPKIFRIINGLAARRKWKSLKTRFVVQNIIRDMRQERLNEVLPQIYNKQEPLSQRIDELNAQKKTTAEIIEIIKVEFADKLTALGKITDQDKNAYIAIVISRRAKITGMPKPSSHARISARDSCVWQISESGKGYDSQQILDIINASADAMNWEPIGSIYTVNAILRRQKSLYNGLVAGQQSRVKE